MSSRRLSSQRLLSFQRRAGLSSVASKLVMVAWVFFLVAAAAQVAGAQENGLPTPFLPAQVHPVSTVPPNGDVNPYGVAFVPAGFPTGTVNRGDILVSNFNNKKNLQGTGTTIVDVPAGTGGTVLLAIAGETSPCPVI